MQFIHLINGMVGTLRKPACYALLAFACGQTSAAGNVKGNINLPIAARPAQPAAIVWSAHIQTAADVALRAKNLLGQPVPNTNTWIGTNFSRHHIIPQTSLQALYQLTQTSNTDVTNDSTKQAITTALKKIQPAGYNVVALGGVVWAPVNLFEGPTGFFRSDDPGSAPEPNKPKSFDNTRWLTLKKVLGTLDAVGALSNDSSTFVVDAKKLNAQGGLTAIRDALAEMAQLVTDQRFAVQPLAETDWIDNNSKAIDLADLIRFNNTTIVVDTPASGLKGSYRLK